eukprot:scaffold338_cov377-Prasinococcus_capsulatus_cf.AAC.7
MDNTNPRTDSSSPMAHTTPRPGRASNGRPGARARDSSNVPGLSRIADRHPAPPSIHQLRPRAGEEGPRAPHVRRARRTPAPAPRPLLLPLRT